MHKEVTNLEQTWINELQMQMLPYRRDLVARTEMQHL